MPQQGELRIIIGGGGGMFGQPQENFDDDDMFQRRFSAGNRNNNKKTRSENFEIVTNSPCSFKDVGGYQNIKLELEQCIDVISNYTKYANYNVRTPKGLIFEGPPGNGKTLLAKALAGEANTSFIAVSGSEFQEKYVGVGSSRIRELFKLATENIPCIVFIDEIDALGRKRTSDGDTSGNERDSTLNELLVAMDGFKNTSGVFLIGATNRADLLDPALIRPGRIDKRIFINNPDEETREAILNIHLQGKPRDDTVTMPDLIENTQGYSGAQIENLVNEAMLLALREDRDKFSIADVDAVYNRVIGGWQPTKHEFTPAIIDQIAIHELGHAVVGMLAKHHGKMKKVVINLSAPNTPAYTLFESSSNSFATREALFEHLMILLAGRIAEEVFYDVSVTTGAINDFEEALKLAQKMICYYGMGKQLIYPSMSEKYKEMIDSEVTTLIQDAYGYAEFIIRNSKDLIEEGAMILKRDELLTSEKMLELMNTKYKHVLKLEI
jgi:cell division protease FtsH